MKCPACYSEFTNVEGKCPNCSHVIKARRFNGLMVFLAVLAFLAALIIFDEFSKSYSNNQPVKALQAKQIVQTTQTTDKVDYTVPWREPHYGAETVMLAKIIVQNGKTGCGIMYVKQIKSYEYVLACSDDGVKWVFYIVNSKSNTIRNADAQVKSKIKPPILN